MSRYLLVICAIFLSMNVVYAKKGDKRITFDFGLGMGYSEDSKEREAITSIPLVSSSIEFDAHLGASVRILGGLNAVGGYVNSWAEGDQEYYYVAPSGTIYMANNIDLDIQKQYFYFGGKYDFLSSFTWSPFIGAGVMRGTVKLKQSGKDLLKYMSEPLPYGNAEKASMTGAYAEVGMRFIWVPAGFSFSFRGYRQQAGPYKTLNHSKVTFKGITFLTNFLITFI